MNQNRAFSQEFLNSMLGSIPFGIVAVDLHGNVIFANKTASEVMLAEPEKGSRSGILVRVRNFPLLSEKISGFLESKEWAPFELEEFSSGRYHSILGVLIPDGFMIVISDITNLKEREANAVQAIISGLEAERRRLARDIHDGIGPLLASAKLEMDSFIDDYNGGNPETLSAKLNSISETIDSVSSDLRDLSHHLMPRLLEEFGLFSAFTSLVNRINNSSRPSVEFYSNLTTADRFDQEVEVNVYRCGQELLNNAVKHARAKEILVQVIRHDRSIVLMVEDDGRGFDRHEQVSGDQGIGLSNIEARVTSINGEFVLESIPNKGTTASIEIPLTKKPGT